MKNTKKSKGFYVALYSCLGLLIAGSLAMAMFWGGNEPPLHEAIPVDTFGVAPVLPLPTQSPVTNQPTQHESAGIREFFGIGNDDDVLPTPEITPESPVAPPAETPTLAPAPVVTPEPEPAAEPAETAEVPEVPAVAVFNQFTDEQVMFWPVLGEVLLEHAGPGQFVFDPTLNLWRGNDKIAISSETGSVVRSAADGVVVDVSYDRRTGNQVTIDHGNGWMTTYSQLENINVIENDVVTGGQIIAQVAEPSLFASGLGENVGFRVTHDGDSINPLYVLQN